MTEVEWLACADARLMIPVVWDEQSDRKKRLYYVACARAIWERIAERDMRSAVETGERLADGLVTPEQHLAAKTVIHNILGDDADPDVKARALNTPEKRSSIAHCVLAVYQLKVCLKPATSPIWALTLLLTGDLQPVLLREVFGNPFRSVTFSDDWRTDTVLALAHSMYESRDFSAMPVFADAIQEAGCENGDVLNHCRSGGAHVRGCWVIDLVLGKE